jgi:hypothetical protein
MNVKQAKKIRQLYNRQMKDEFVLLRSFLRPKPRFMPKWLHSLGFKFYFNIK